MNRILALSVYLYMCLAAAHWASVAHLLHGPTGRLWCGNAITDPLLFLIDKLTPVIAGSRCESSAETVHRPDIIS
jgi:hypothetical protein